MQTAKNIFFVVFSAKFGYAELNWLSPAKILTELKWASPSYLPNLI